jgi:hypothetical protein
MCRQFTTLVVLFLLCSNPVAADTIERMRVRGVPIPVPRFQQYAGEDGYEEQGASFASATTGIGYVNNRAANGELCRAYVGQDTDVKTGTVTKYINLRYMISGQCNDFWFKKL